MGGTFAPYLDGSDCVLPFAKLKSDSPIVSMPLVLTAISEAIWNRISPSLI